MEEFLIYLIKSSGILALFWCCFKLFLQQETFFTFHRAFLISGIFMALLFPFWTLTELVTVEALPYTLMETSITNSTPIADPIFNWWQIAGILYLIGVFFFLGRFVLQLASLRRLLNRGITVRNGRFTYIETQKDTSPFSFFHIIVYNPALHSPTELETILAHEKVHSLQKHSLDILLIHLFSAFQWINPFVWYYKTTLSQNLEYIADQGVAKTMGNCKEYQYLLLKNASAPIPHSSIINPIFNSSIKKRIVMLNKNRSHQFKAWKFSLVIPFLAFFLVAFNTNTVTQVNPQTIETEPGTSTGNPTESGVNETKSWVIGRPFEIRNDSVNSPLYIVDGIEYGPGSKPADLDPKNIFSINVVKGDDAINQYGDKGKNGVIKVLTLKKLEFKGTGDDLKFLAPRDNNSTDPNTQDKTPSTITVTGYNSTDPNTNDKTPSTITVTGYKVGPNSKPLIILDGVEKEDDFNMNTISPDTIDSIQVFKDGKAIQKFGAKGENGVIEITTRKK